jgi:hypothetical protein
MTKQEAKLVIDEIKGQFFGITFTKRTNGETRKMNCRKGVTKDQNGGGLPYDAASKGLVTVWDAKAPGPNKYRSFAYDSVTEIRHKGQVIKVN